MTSIVIDPVNLRFSAKGHAGYAEKGSDIVCAAISAVVTFVEAYVDGQELAKRTHDGYVFIWLPSDLPGAKRLLDTAFIMLQSLQHQYPDYIEVEYREEA